MDKQTNMNRFNKTIEKKFNEKRLVLGNGSVDSKIILIGEAPGKNEVEQRKPFVGAAGKYLNEFLEILKLDRKDIYITNVVKYRPTKKSKKTGRDINRTPIKEEINNFTDYLFEEISIIEPDLIVTLGNVPFKTILENNSVTIGNYHGKKTNKTIMGKEYIVYPLYHPAAVIYNRSIKDDYINDLKNLKNILDKHIYI
ncbi:uracil-DNA glycosylase [Senegalia massiliensis]|uniref:Type-4 uracil-DNA glycosylase n=1 Tax=Senegalia massiliensis TaxID=1720316 RepID=A0A845R0U0_9CLOT|nr:uracil-DNA glycosylase [Senegalia massiliensis]NBI08315.1 uracil-DNA glycosylase [Senegalia massiliensis]